jgi:hypothetical protein
MALQPNEVKTEHIATGAVTTPKIADESVTTAKLKDGAVKTEKLATGAVTGSKIGEAQIYGSKLRDGAVRAEKIAAGAVTTSKIGELQVTTSRLQDKSVTTDKLASGAVTTEKIANASVTPAKLSFTPPSVARPITPPLSGVEIADGAVTEPKIGNAAVTWPKIAAGSITPDKLIAVAPPADTEVASFDAATGNFKWVPPAVPVAPVGLYVPRSPAVEDFKASNFIHDAAIHVDGLDLSGIVPAGATAVILKIACVSLDGGTQFALWQDSAFSPIYWQKIQLPGVDAPDQVWIVPCQPDRLFDYLSNMTGVDEVTRWLHLHVIGWFI